jgi:hypothetical protein
VHPTDGGAIRSGTQPPYRERLVEHIADMFHLS